VTITLLIALAAYRAWRLLALDAIAAPLRLRLRGCAAELVSCPWCLGTWLTAGFWALAWWQLSFAAPGLVLGAAAALTGVLGALDQAWSDRA